MKEIDIKIFQLRARSSAFRKEVERANEIIVQALSVSSEWYVSFSGGKDSTVVLDLVRGFLPNVHIFWSDEEFYLPETGAYIERLKESGMTIVRCRGEIKHTDWFVSNKGSQELGKTAKAKSLGLDGVFLGLRAEENNYRRVFLRTYSPLHYAEKRDMWLCNPIAWWSVYDVWAYIISRGIDYNRAYDKLSELGVPIGKQRIGPYATEKALGYGQLAILKAGWPEEYQRFVDKFPQGGGYV